MNVPPDTTAVPTDIVPRDVSAEPSFAKKTRGASKASSVVHNLLTSGLLNVIQVLTGVIVTRQIGATEKGIYAFLLLFSTFLLPMLSFGANNGSRYLISSKRFAMRETVFSCFAFGIVQGGFTAAVGLTLWYFGWLGETGDQIPVYIVLPVLLALPIRGAVMAMEDALVADSQFKFVNRMTLVEACTSSTLLWLLVIFCDYGLPGIVTTILAAVLVRVGISTYYCWAWYRPQYTVHMGFLRAALAYGLRSWLGFMAKRTNLRLDHVFVGFLAPSATLGIYSVATMISETMWKLEAAIGPVFFNKIAETKDEAERAILLGRLIRTVVYVLTAAVLPLIVLSHFVVPWALGEEFRPVTVLICFLAPGIVFGSAFRVLNKFFGATGNPWLITLSQLTALAFSVAVYWLAINSFGLAGAAIASSIVYCIAAVASMSLLRKRYQIPTMILLFGASPVSDVRWMASQIRHALLPKRSASNPL